MGEISVYFVGICTFMQDVEGQLPGVRRRVVLVNAREPQVINGNSIPPHIPTLRIAAGDLQLGGVPATTENGSVLEWQLHGCRIEIADAVGDLQRDETFECCVPHLKVLTPDASGISRAVVLAARPEEASCYFDMTAGQLSAGLAGEGAAVSVLKVQTAGDSPTLRVRQFGAAEAQEFHLRSGAEIALVNVGVEGMAGDDPNDFLLHYKVLETIPENAAVPTQPATCCSTVLQSYILPPRLGVGPACSNSNFP